MGIIFMAFITTVVIFIVGGVLGEVAAQLLKKVFKDSEHEK